MAKKPTEPLTAEQKQSKAARIAQMRAEQVQLMEDRQKGVAPKAGEARAKKPKTPPPKGDDDMDKKPDHEVTLTSADIAAMLKGDEPKGVSNFYDTIEGASKSAKELGEVTILLTIKKGK